MKHTYLVGINDISEKMESFQYNYQKMVVQIGVSSKGFTIIYQTGTSKSLNEVWESNIVEDATRKCMLIQLILFGNNPAFEKAIVMENDTRESKTFYSQRVFGLIDSGSNVDLTPIKDKSFITNYLISTVQSNYESGIAALFSYIFAKSKKSEEEKFTYYWRAFNGLYSSLAKEDTYHRNTNKDLDTEKSMIQNWIYNNEFTSDSVSKLFNRKVDKELSFEDVNRKFRRFGYIIRGKIAQTNWTQQDIYNALKAPGNTNTNLAQLLNLKDFLYPQDNSKMWVPIDDKKYIAHISLYSFLMAELAYQMRCDYFHARKPILLYTTATNQSIRSLKLVNVLLENYLDNNILRSISEKIDFDRNTVEK